MYLMRQCFVLVNKIILNNTIANIFDQFTETFILQVFPRSHKVKNTFKNTVNGSKPLIIVFKDRNSLHTILLEYMGTVVDI